MGTSHDANAQGTPTKVTLRTDFRVAGYHAPFALAIERGYYKEQGLDVEIAQGQGSSVTIQTIASGGDLFGIADASTTVIAISARGIPVKVVAAYAQSDTQGFAYHPTPGWDGDLNKLRQKVLISSTGSSELSIIPGVLASTNMTMDDMQVQLVDVSARVPLFLQTPGAFLGGYATGDVLRIKAKLPTVGFVPFSKFGITAYGASLIVTLNTIQKNPELVRKFVSASGRGWSEALKDPEPAVQSLTKLFPDVDAHFMREGLKVVLSSQLHTPATKGNPIGWTAESDWKSMLDTLEKYSKVKPRPLPNYYTNEFIAKP
ncbi:MAG: ABC transporter substrate-binding protein [Burkholderiales bacterium]